MTCIALETDIVVFVVSGAIHISNVGTFPACAVYPEQGFIVMLAVEVVLLTLTMS